LRQPPEVLVGEKLRFSSCAREYLLRTQHIPSIGEIGIISSWVIPEWFARISASPHPRLSSQYKLDRRSRPADDRLTGEDLRIERDA